MIKNTASQHVGAQMVSATDGSAFTGAVTVSVTGDAGTQATGSVGSGACTHEGNGYHTYAPAQAETDYNLIAFTFTGTGAIPVTVQIYTITGDAFARLGAPTGASISADIQTRLAPTVAGRTLDVSAGGEAGIDWANIGSQTSTVDLANTSISFADEVGLTDEVVVVGANAITRDSIHYNTGLQSIWSGVAQAGSATTITLDTNASTTNDIYNNNLIHIVSGAGVNQVARIIDYVGATKVATIAPSWTPTTPDNTSTFVITADMSIWDDPQTSHTLTGSFGAYVESIKLALDNNLDAAVSTRLASSAITLNSGKVTVGTNDDKTNYTVATGGIAAASFAAGAIDSAAIAANAIGSSELAQSAAQEVADEILDRDIAGGGSGGTRNVRSALRRLRNRVAISAGTVTVYQEDDSTGAWTAAVTTAAGNPVTEVDPN